MHKVVNMVAWAWDGIVPSHDGRKEPEDRVDHRVLPNAARPQAPDQSHLVLNREVVRGLVRPEPGRGNARGSRRRMLSELQGHRQPAPGSHKWPECGLTRRVTCSTVPCCSQARPSVAPSSPRRPCSHSRVRQPTGLILQSFRFAERLRARAARSAAFRAQARPGVHAETHPQSRGSVSVCAKGGGRAELTVWSRPTVQTFLCGTAIYLEAATGCRVGDVDGVIHPVEAKIRLL